MYDRPLFGGLLSSVMIPEMAELAAPEDRKLCAVGMTKLLTCSSLMLSPNYLPLW